MSSTDQEVIITEVLGFLPISSFSQTRDLDVLRYLKGIDLLSYVTITELASRSYVRNTQLKNTTGALDLPPDIEQRLQDLEADAIGPAGYFAHMEAALKDTTNRKPGSAVLIGGYTFRDQQETEAWAKSLSVDNLVSFVPDARIQISALVEGFHTKREVLSAIANTSKAGFCFFRSPRVQMGKEWHAPSWVRESVARRIG